MGTLREVRDRVRSRIRRVKTHVRIERNQKLDELAKQAALQDGAEAEFSATFRAFVKRRFMERTT